MKLDPPLTFQVARRYFLLQSHVPRARLEAFAQNEDRLARFEGEARLLAALDHPNIATLYGFEQSDGVHFLIMELADGETLTEQLRHGPIPVEDAIPIFKQITEAMEAAHKHEPRGSIAVRSLYNQELIARELPLFFVNTLKTVKKHLTASVQQIFFR